MHALCLFPSPHSSSRGNGGHFYCWISRNEENQKSSMSLLKKWYYAEVTLRSEKQKLSFTGKWIKLGQEGWSTMLFMGFSLALLYKQTDLVVRLESQQENLYRITGKGNKFEDGDGQTEYLHKGKRQASNNSQWKYGTHASFTACWVAVLREILLLPKFLTSEN